MQLMPNESLTAWLHAMQCYVYVADLQLAVKMTWMGDVTRIIQLQSIVCRCGL